MQSARNILCVKATLAQPSKIKEGVLRSAKLVSIATQMISAHPTCARTTPVSAHCSRHACSPSTAYRAVHWDRVALMLHRRFRTTSVVLRDQMESYALLILPMSACQATAPPPFLVKIPNAPQSYQVMNAQTQDNALTSALLVFANDYRFVCQPFCFQDRINNYLGQVHPINVTTFI